jgi:hypothetical protein
VLIAVSVFIALNRVFPKLLLIFTIPGRVPLFFYGMHIAIMGVFIKRTGFLYREGGVMETLIAFAVMMVVMIPLCIWFYRVKSRSGNFIIKMI